MSIGSIINYYSDKHTPYIGSLVNHLPMAQLSIYNMTGDLNKVEAFTRVFLERVSIDAMKSQYPSIDNIDVALGNRDLYEPTLDIINRELNENNAEEYIRKLLNKYNRGLSSGLFHTTIRLAYGIEGLKIDPLFIDEVKRGLAYYITAYRESDLSTNKIDGSSIKHEMTSLIRDKEIIKILNREDSLGKKMRALYNKEYYLDRAFTIKGDEKEKIRALLDLLIPAYYFSGNIVVLHCITGLHASIVLKKYFDDFNQTLDILTISIITHLLAIGYTNYNRHIDEATPISWEAILSMASEKYDAHTIKLAYTSHELYKLFGIKGLKEIAYKRILNT